MSMSFLKQNRVVGVVLVVAFLMPQITIAYHYGQERINMKDINALTLRKGKMTGGNKPVKQLECTSGSARGMFEPSVVQCKNQGWDGREVQWECSAEMPRDYSFGEITVTCEGWNGPGDQDVVVGSCGLEYALELTETGRRNKDRNSRFSSDYNRGGRYDSYDHKSSQSSGSGSFMVFVGVCIAFYMLYKCSTSRTNGVPSAPPPPYSEGHARGGGGGFGSGFGSSSGRNYSSGYGSSSSSRSTGNNGPGFWSGMAAGGLLGSMFGGRNRGYGSGYGYGGMNGGGFRSRRSGWGTGWGSSVGSGSARGSSSSSSSSGGGSSSSSSGSYTSRGFGGSRSR